MSENLIGRMFVGPNGARYTFEGFEKTPGGLQDAMMRDLSGSRRRFKVAGWLKDSLIIGWLNHLHNRRGWFELKPLVPAEATELTVSRDVDDQDLWVLTWEVGAECFGVYLSPTGTWPKALAEARRISGRRTIDVIAGFRSTGNTCDAPMIDDDGGRHYYAA